MKDKAIEITDNPIKDLRNTLIKYVGETRKNFSHVFQDRIVDRELLEDIYKQDGNLNNKIELLVSSVNELTKALKNVDHAIDKQPEEFAEKVVENLQVIQEEINQAKKDKPAKRSLLDKILRRKKER